MVVLTGTRVTGNITEVISGSRAIGATPTLGLKFNQLELEDGQIIPITGELYGTGLEREGPRCDEDPRRRGGRRGAGSPGQDQQYRQDRRRPARADAIGAVAAKNTGRKRSPHGLDADAYDGRALHRGESATPSYREVV